jgi:hypothetical protein
VYAEFIIAFVPFFLMFLGGVQLALIAQARVVVQHAASLAVRSAVVNIDDDPVFYEDGKRKELSTQGEGKGADKSQNLLEGLSKQGAPKGAKSESSGSERLNKVRNASYLPLSAIGPSHEQVLQWFTGALTLAGGKHSLQQTLGDAPLMRVLTNIAIYTRVASALTFPKALGSDELRHPDQAWRDAETVRVRVTYLFPCTVPLVRAMACRSLSGIEQLNLRSAARAIGKSNEKKEPFDQALDELAHAEWADMQKLLYALPNERFLALRGEAALPNQGAPYLYPSELCKTKQKAPGVECGGNKR